MERDLKDIIPLEFVFVETRGWNSHIDIIRTRKLSPEDEAAILAAFENHMHVLQATVNQKIKFQKLVEECEEMDWVNNENHWAGLGAVRFIPSCHRRAFNEVDTDSTSRSPQLPNGQIVASGESSPSASSASSANSTPPTTTTKSKAIVSKDEKTKEEIDHLNAQIVNKLRAIDSAFSLGEASTGEWCVQFGMVTEETDVHELVRLVAATGQEIEENSEFFNRMSELVRKGECVVSNILV
jgi:cell division septation protein DedD